MTFKQVLSQWAKEAMMFWDDMQAAEKWIVCGIALSVLLLIISVWRVL